MAVITVRGGDRKVSIAITPSSLNTSSVHPKVAQFTTRQASLHAWALLGDLATRRGLDEDARRYYRTALSLNPRDPGLIQAAGGGEVSGP